MAVRSDSCCFGAPAGGLKHCPTATLNTETDVVGTVDLLPNRFEVQQPVSSSMTAQSPATRVSPPRHRTPWFGTGRLSDCAITESLRPVGGVRTQPALLSP